MRCGHCYPYVAGSILIKWTGEKEPHNMAMLALKHCDKEAEQQEVVDTIIINGHVTNLVVNNCKEHSIANRPLPKVKD